MSKIYDNLSCATSNIINDLENIDLTQAENYVKKLQRRISVAWQKGCYDKVCVLQHKLIHSFYAKYVSVNTVMTNKGRYTSGVDNVLWTNTEDKFNAICDLNRRGYNHKPLKRIYIPKPNGKERPLSIPTMKDRAMQTLYKLALEPISEITADVHSYGFRAERNSRGAILQCINVLTKAPYPMWILEADIKSCFDNISHEWIMKHIPVDKEILLKFLKCGYVENGIYYPTERGIPQGGSLSTVICNMVLDGLENRLLNEVSPDLNFVRYADDFVVIGTDRAILEEKAIPIIENFLNERGLQLSAEKTAVVNITDGFDFLGWNTHKSNDNLMIVPSKKNADILLMKIENAIKDNPNLLSDEMYNLLKPIISGWLNYHNGVADRYALLEMEFEVVSLIWRLTEDKNLSRKVSYIFSVV